MLLSDTILFRSSTQDTLRSVTPAGGSKRGVVNDGTQIVALQVQ